jgi:hypothetical protein
VFIDNVYRGNTPLTLVRIEPGTYGVTFSRFGYAKLSMPVRVESGKTTEVDVALILLTGSLDITSGPAGARILLDAVHQGVTPVSLPNITVGNHMLTVRKEGYITSEQTITVVEDRTTQITISLVPASPPFMDTLQAAGPAPAALIAGFIMILLVIRYLRRE